MTTDLQITFFFFFFCPRCFYSCSHWVTASLGGGLDLCFKDCGSEEFSGLAKDKGGNEKPGLELSILELSLVLPSPCQGSHRAPSSGC